MSRLEHVLLLGALLRQVYEQGREDVQAGRDSNPRVYDIETLRACSSVTSVAWLLLAQRFMSEVERRP